MFFLAGLGNPGEKYALSRHNAGRQAVDYFEVRSSKLETRKLKIIESPEFMNNSGRAIAKFVKSKKAAEKLIVVYDDIDLPLGSMKISWDKGSGGHRGLESVIKAVKTKEFIRIRIGVSPSTPSGKIKKPQGEKKVLDFILGNFSPKEKEILKKVFKKASEAIEVIVSEGREVAMNKFN